MKQPEIKTTKRYLKVTFGERELLDFARQSAEVTRQLHEAEEARKAAASQFKSTIDRLTAEVTQHARRIRDGYEFRDVQCEVVYDWKRGTKYLTRLDTSETFEEPIGADERQPSMV